jgi:hypothetical protein
MTAPPVGLTESARLRKLMFLNRPSGCFPAFEARQGNPELCCPPPPGSNQPVITPAESVRIASLMVASSGVFTNGVTQGRAKELLALAGARKQFESEGVRIEREIQNLITCASNSESPDSRFIAYKSPILPVECPPLPPPPAPPARSCIPTKAEKFY